MAGCVPPLLVFFWLRGYLHKENALYKKNCNRMLLRGITIPHGVFLAFLIHGLYDFSLRDELQTVSLDLDAAIAFPVVLLDVILIIVLIVFARRHKNDPKYTTPLKEVPPQLRSKGLSEEQIAQKMHTLRRELGQQYKEAAPPGARTIVRRWLL